MAAEAGEGRSGRAASTTSGRRSELAADIAELVGPGDLVTLSGGLGAGKTTFARALIRLLTGDADLEVPSPTFLLMQSYEGKTAPIVHADFYRIGKPGDLIELGWDEAVDGALVLVEWPDRGGDHLNADRLDIDFAIDSDHGEGGAPGASRTATVTGFGAFAGRLAKAKAIQQLLEPTSWRDARRQFMQGDASSRSFERLVKEDGSSAVLMIAPRQPDGPPIRYGKPYSAIAHLAEGLRPYVAIDRGLRARGFFGPGDLCFRSVDRSHPAGGSGLRADYGRRRRRPRALRACGGGAREAARPRPARCPAGRGRGDLPHSRLRPRRAFDRGRTAGRLVCAPSRARAAVLRRQGDLRQSLAENPDGGLARGVDMDPARLSFAQSHLDARARGRREDRHGRFPGLRAGSSRL